MLKDLEVKIDDLILVLTGKRIPFGTKYGSCISYVDEAIAKATTLMAEDKKKTKAKNK